MINKVLYILGQLTDEDADWLGQNGRRMRLNRGDVLIARGIRLEKLFFVLDGELRIMSPRHDLIARAGVGEIIGELSLLDESPTSADVVAQTAVNVLCVKHAPIFKRMAEDPAFAARFYKALAMLLALRMRTTLSRFGAGDQPLTVVNYPSDRDPLAHADLREVAGGRFERMVRTLAGLSPRAEG